VSKNKCVKVQLRDCRPLGTNLISPLCGSVNGAWEQSSRANRILGTPKSQGVVAGTNPRIIAKFVTTDGFPEPSRLADCIRWVALWASSYAADKAEGFGPRSLISRRCVTALIGGQMRAPPAGLRSPRQAPARGNVWGGSLSAERSFTSYPECKAGLRRQPRILEC
jgi:hypothetical protein